MGMNDTRDFMFDRKLTIQVFAASLMIAFNIGEYLCSVIGYFTD